MSIIANRYVQALLELPKNENQKTVFHKGIKEVAEVFSSNNEFEKVMLDPRIAYNTKMEIVKEIFPEYCKEKSFANFIELLIKEKRIGCIKEISDEYSNIISMNNKELKIKIVTASKIDENQIKEIVEKYKTMYEVKTVKYDVEIDESLLGGVKVIVGNKVYDGSIGTQLKQMF